MPLFISYLEQSQNNSHRGFNKYSKVDISLVASRVPVRVPVLHKVLTAHIMPCLCPCNSILNLYPPGSEVTVQCTIIICARVFICCSFINLFF